MYITAVVDVVYSTYSLHVIFLQHRSIETNPGLQKEKNKNFSYCHWNINNFVAHNLRLLNLKHIIQFINMILSVYLKCSLTLQCKNGTKISNWMARICSGWCLYLLQRNSGVKSLRFSECIIYEVSMKKRKDCVSAVYRSSSQNIFELILRKF